LPYRTEARPDGSVNNGFMDLRGRPEAAAIVTEAQASGYLPDLLVALATPGSRYL